MNETNKTENINKLAQIIETGQNTLITKFLIPFSEEARYQMIWELLAERLEIFNEENFSLILQLCEGLDEAFVIEYLLLLDRFDLAKVFITINGNPRQKFIDKQIIFYSRYSDFKRIKNKDELSFLDIDDEEKQRMHKHGIKVISWLETYKV